MWKGRWTPHFDTTSIAAHIDVLPTLARLAGIPIPDSLRIDGLDLSSALEEQNAIDTARIYFEDFSYEAVRDPGLFEGGIARQHQWKMYAGSELYDLWADPGELHDFSNEYPHVLRRLNKAYEKYYVDVFGNGLLHPRPIEVGHQEENPIYIKAHHGRAEGNVQFVGYRGHDGERVGAHPVGVDGDWTSTWTSNGDAMEWTVDFVKPGTTYEIGVLVKGSVPMTDVELRLEVGSQEELIRIDHLSDKIEWSYLTLLKGAFFGVQEVKIELRDSIVDGNLAINALVVKAEQ